MNRAPANSTVAVLGASPKEERYSFKAMKMLTEHGHRPVPVHPSGHEVLGQAAVASLDDVPRPVDTLTMYVGPAVSDGEYHRIIRLKPRRVVFNPGAENSTLARKLEEAGIEVVEACTLVLLQTGQF
ncbi:MAG: CoA-binding protein [Candidatus Zixiibacteriota bacterium]|nr:MAG: CoA-binding protein [candidate division Zixibacteria bacterium]